MELATANGPITNYMNLEELFTLENLNNAFYESTANTGWKDSVQRYKANLLQNNVQLREELISGTYKVRPTFNFTLCERGKTRNIEAPAIQDRIVQKIICQQILIPQIKKLLIYDNYASLKDRGTAFARRRLDAMLHDFINKNGDGYVLQIDVKNYFGTIDHNILKQMIHENVVADEEVMNLIDYIIDNSSSSDKGLNLGSEIPQICAVFYLSKPDNFIKSVRGIKHYGRYMDDMISFSTSKQELKELLDDIKQQLAELKMEINEKKTHITKLSHGFTFMQIKYSVDGKKIIKRPTHAKIFREKRRLRKYRILYDKGIMTLREVELCYWCWKYCILKDCKNSRKSVYSVDKLFISLFPDSALVVKPTRSKVVDTTFKENIGLLLEIGYVNNLEMEKELCII